MIHFVIHIFDHWIIYLRRCEMNNNCHSRQQCQPEGNNIGSWQIHIGFIFLRINKQSN